MIFIGACVLIGIGIYLYGGKAKAISAAAVSAATPAPLQVPGLAPQRDPLVDVVKNARRQVEDLHDYDLAEQLRALMKGQLTPITTHTAPTPNIHPAAALGEKPAPKA